MLLLLLLLGCTYRSLNLKDWSDDRVARISASDEEVEVVANGDDDGDDDGDEDDDEDDDDDE